MLSLSYSWLRLPSSLDLKLEIVKKRGVGSAGFGMGSTNEYGWFGVGYKIFLLVIASCRRILVIRLGRKERPQYNSPHCSSRTLLAKSLSGSSLARDKLQRKMCKSGHLIPFQKVFASKGMGLQFGNQSRAALLVVSSECAFLLYNHSCSPPYARLEVHSLICIESLFHKESMWLCLMLSLSS